MIVNARHQTLSEALAELERTDPAVAVAAARLEESKAEILRGGSYRERARRAIQERRVASNFDGIVRS